MRISVVIPTYNEEDNIGRLVSELRQYGGTQLAEVIVVDAPSTDRTAEVAQAAGAKVVVADQPGRACQMNAGAQIATGEVLYFVHADVHIHPDYVDDIEQAVAEGYTLGCYRYQFDSPRLLLKINAFFQRFDRIWSRGGDQTLFITKKEFDQLEGYCEKHRVMEDYEFIIRARKQHRFKIIPKNIIVSSRKYDENSYFRVNLANAVVMWMYFRGASQQKLIDTYKSLIKTEKYGVKSVDS
ncbi:TIGR04283 family arsenosugar biosynthesis glycosyltransferase [Persicitalea jodogahamensis]|uniref:Glycosyl hydrolase n=1 Tax=Persicitalea jodogahamensis TaxID=402147 RepID=A0A8J3GA09_9BACT|nr:TIGR04283 family arsenosugar biosynthesis glycosyltransferase [Persicitalea jodogahamensis]GHB68801.1 glycosyl hydrolase [Persicitalea jodogahamensis]